MNDKLFSNPQIRKLKALGQHLEPVLHLGKEGATEAFIKSVDAELELHELIKIKFAAFKEERQELSGTIAEKTGSFPVMQVGHVLVLYRAASDPARRKVEI